MSVNGILDTLNRKIKSLVPGKKHKLLLQKSLKHKHSSHIQSVKEQKQTSLLILRQKKNFSSFNTMTKNLLPRVNFSDLCILVNE
jgi:hypothetical protein